MEINHYVNQNFGVVLLDFNDGYNVEMYDVNNRVNDPFMIMHFDSLILALLAYDEILQEV